MYAADYDNPWVREIETAPRPLPAWAAVLAGSIFAATVLLLSRRLAPQAAAQITKVLGHLAAPWPDILTFGALQFIVFGAFLVAAVAATRIEGRSLWRLGPGWPGALGAGFGVGLVGFCASVGVAWLAGAVTVGHPPHVSTPLAGVAAGLLFVAFQSAAEEAFFRGWLQPVLCARWGPWLGLVATSMLFAALHVIAGAHSLLAVANLFLGGMVFGLLALRSGGLLAPWAAHFAWNWTESGLLGLDLQPTGHLFDLQLRGTKMWSGAADTMNGSLATTIVLAALTAVLVLVGPSRSAPPAAHRSDRVP